MAHNKPVSAKDQLGPNVTFSSQSHEPDQWASNMIRESDKGMIEPGMTYLGSVCTHFYLAGDIKVTKEAAMKHMLIGSEPGKGLGDGVNERIASFAVADLALSMRKHYHPEYKYKTTDQRDKRWVKPRTKKA